MSYIGKQKVIIMENLDLTLETLRTNLFDPR
jgi:hypothetical protein